MADESGYQEGQFCWHEIATRDAAQAKEFYAALFDYDMEDTPMPGGGGTYTMVRTSAGDAAGLYQMDGPMFEGVPPHWAPYVWVDDVAATCEKAKSLGGKVAAEPMAIEGVGTVAFVSDPTGATLGLYSGSGHGGAAQGMAPGQVGWNELATPDPGQAGAFYSALFGWDSETGPVPGGEGEYTLFKMGDHNVAGMMAMEGPDWENVPPHWMPYVTVADCQACVDRAQELDAQVLVPPRSIQDVGTFAVLQDPGGAVFSIMKWELPG